MSPRLLVSRLWVGRRRWRLVASGLVAVVVLPSAAWYTSRSERSGAARLAFVYPTGNLCAQAPYGSLRGGFALNVWKFWPRSVDQILRVTPLRAINVVPVRAYVTRLREGEREWTTLGHDEIAFALPYTSKGRELMEVDIEYRIVDPSKPVGVLGGVLTYTVDGERRTSVVGPRALVIDAARPGTTPPPRDLCRPIAATPWSAPFDETLFHTLAGSSGGVPPAPTS